MSKLTIVEKEQKKLPDQEIIARLVYEMQRNAMVWNLFAGTIIDGWLPGRDGLAGAKFEGSDLERINQLYKIRDYEVPRILDVLRELNIADDGPPPAYAPIYEELSRNTEITATTYKPL